MEHKASLIATLTEEPGERAFENLPAGVDWLEVRADLVGEIDPDWLRSRFPGRLIYTLRSRAEGGRFEGSLARRRQRLLAAGEHFDRIDLELNRDLSEILLEKIPAEKRVVSWHGAARDSSGLRKLVQRADLTPAVLYKFVPTAKEARDEMAPLQLLAELGRRDVIAFAAGEGGIWTRFVAPHLGAPLLYGALGSRAGAPGQPTVGRICNDFGFPEMRPLRSVAGIVGNPVGHSLSPRLHNGVYRALGVEALYLPFQPERFADFWLEVVEGNLFESMGCPISALSVTAPFKSLAVAVAGACSPLAQRIDSANTLVRTEGVWEAESTDPAGVVKSLEKRGIDIANKRVAVIGCGGAGRAAAAGLAAAGGDLTLVNRTVEKGHMVATSLGLDFLALEDFDPRPFAILVNATSLGHGSEDPLPFEVESLEEDRAVVDLVYGEEPTPLVARARHRGLAVVDGREVLLHQAAAQFQLMTGTELPLELGRELLDIGSEEAA